MVCSLAWIVFTCSDDRDSQEDVESLKSTVGRDSPSLDAVGNKSHAPPNNYLQIPKCSLPRTEFCCARVGRAYICMQFEGCGIRKLKLKLKLFHIME